MSVRIDLLIQAFIRDEGVPVTFDQIYDHLSDNLQLSSSDPLMSLLRPRDDQAASVTESRKVLEIYLTTLAHDKKIAATNLFSIQRSEFTAPQHPINAANTALDRSRTAQLIKVTSATVNGSLVIKLNINGSVFDFTPSAVDWLTDELTQCSVAARGELVRTLQET